MKDYLFLQQNFLRVFYQREVHEPCYIWNEALCNNSLQLWDMNLDVTCRRVCKSPSVYLISMFYNRSTLNPRPPVTKGNNKFDIYFVKIFSMNQKSNQILLTRENQILHRQENSLMFFQTITSSYCKRWNK